MRWNGGAPLAQVLLAVDGSTNGLVHWAVVAGQLGLKVAACSRLPPPPQAVMIVTGPM